MRWRSIMSIEPRSLNRPSINAGSGVLCASRPSMSGRPNANSNRSGVHSAPSSASFSSQTRRSCVITAISSCHTRSIAGLRRSYSRSWTSRIAAVRRCCAAGSVSDRQRQQAIRLQPAQRGRLHLMEQIAARQRIHLLQRRRRLERRQPIDRRHQELVRARRIALQRRQRIRAARPDAATASAARVASVERTMPSAGSHCLRCQRNQREVSDRCSSGLSSYRYRARPLTLSGGVAQQRRHRRQVVLEVVDGGVGGRAAPATPAWRRRPADARAASVDAGGMCPSMARAMSST